jgi:glycosyltransferase involved in cell wall biosynthesis
MTILNIMWAGGSAFASVHKVHQQILSQIEPATPVKTWLLQGSADDCVLDVGEIREWNLSTERLKGKQLWWLVKPWMRAGFKQALLESGASVVLLDGMGVARALLPVLKKLPQLRAVVIFHGSTRLHSADRKLFHQFPSSRLTVAAVSQTLASSLQSDLQVPVTALRSAFDPVAFRAAVVPRAQSRTRLGLPIEAPWVLGAVGRLVNDKGFACLLEAFAAALVHQPDLRLVIIGEGSARAALEAQIDQWGLRGNVSLPGYLNDVATLYSAFDWVAIPSLDEGLGLILQEAVMAGIPVLSSELAVFREQLAGTGWYAPAGDVSAWSDIIVQAFNARPEAVAAEQYEALAPDKAWLGFSQAVRALLSCRQ